MGSHLGQATRVKMNSSSTAESRVSRCCRAPKLALAGSSRRPETAAAVAEEPEPVPDVPPGLKDADFDRRVLKRKSGEGVQPPIIKKAKTVDASSSEEEYPHKWQDFDWERPGGGPKVMYEFNFPRVRIFAECSEDSDDENCRPIWHKHPLDAEIEWLVEDLRVKLKRWVYFFK